MNMNRELITELIERYLEGDMSPVEKAAFEERLENDPSFLKEYELHMQVRRSFSWEMDRRSLRSVMHHAHREMEGPGLTNKSIIKVKGTVSVRRIILIAASVSLLISAGSLVTYNLIQENEARSSYARLNRTSSPVESTKAVIEENAVAPANVSDSEEKQQTTIATAFAIHEDGWMLTNHHVVAGKKYVYVEKMADSLNRYVAEVIASDKRLDIALIRVSDPAFIKLPQIPYVFGTEDAMIGQRVFTLGYPKDDIVYSEGPVSSLTGYKSDTIALQLSLPVNPGNSGAPVFSENGELMGVITGKNIEADGAAYGLKVSHLREFLQNCEEYKESLPKKNLLKGKKLTDQVKRIDSFIFLVKA